MNIVSVTTKRNVFMMIKNIVSEQRKGKVCMVIKNNVNALTMNDN